MRYRIQVRPGSSLDSYYYNPQGWVWWWPFWCDVSSEYYKDEDGARRAIARHMHYRRKCSYIPVHLGTQEDAFK